MEFIQRENGFSVIVDGKEIIVHSIENPCIYVGTGQGTYDMFRGNFKVKDYICEKIALNDFEILKENSGVTVTFSKSGLNALKVLFIEEEGRTVIKFLENKIGRAHV